MNLWPFCTFKRLRKFRRQRCGPGRLMLWMLTRSEPMHRASSGLQPAEHCRASTGSAPPLPQDACQISARVSILWRQKGREALRKWRDPNARTARFSFCKIFTSSTHAFPQTAFFTLGESDLLFTHLEPRIKNLGHRPGPPLHPRPLWDLSPMHLRLWAREH